MKIFIIEEFLSESREYMPTICYVSMHAKTRVFFTRDDAYEYFETLKENRKNMRVACYERTEV